MARRTKLTSERQKKIVDAIRAGNYADIAARYAGIDPATYHTWMKRGRESDTPEHKIYREFHNAVKEAQAQAEIRDVALISKAAQENWQAAAWRLERKSPNRWGRSEKRYHEHKVTDIPAVDLRLAPETSEKAHELLRQLGADNTSGPSVQGE